MFIHEGLRTGYHCSHLNTSELTSEYLILLFAFCFLKLFEKHVYDNRN